MKKNIYRFVCAISVVCGFASCSDFLEVEPRNIVIEEQFWNEKKDVENVVAGCYEGMQASSFITRLMAWGEFRSENVTVGEFAERDDLHMYKLLNENIDAQNNYTDWSSIYKVINRCNTAILKAPKVAAVDPSFTESELKATIAEMSALRDLCYFYLIRTFRDVPYTTTAFTDDDQKMDLPATPFNDVLDSLIVDLESVRNDAVKRYPESDEIKSLYQTGRITQDVINAMLCEMYLWKQDYQKCIDYADLVLESKRKYAEEKEGTLMSDMNTYFEGYPLIRDWMSQENMFGNSYSTIFGDGNSAEGIFELTFRKNDNMLANSAVSTYYGNNANTYYYRVRPSDYVGLDQSNGVYKLFHKFDARSYSSFHATLTSKTKTYIGKYVMSSVQWERNASTGTVTPNSYSIWGDGKNHANWVIYRLADIMLLKAEALVQLAADDTDEKLEEAFEIVQVIDRRSLMKNPTQIVEADLLKFSDYNSKDKMEELVMEERHRELLFEGKRWFDLVRRSLRDGNTQYLRNQLGNKGLKNASIVSSKLTRMEAIFWPYNLNELKVNHNLTQNPAFGSGESESYENSATNS